MSHYKNVAKQDSPTSTITLEAKSIRHSDGHGENTLHSIHYRRVAQVDDAENAALHHGEAIYHISLALALFPPGLDNSLYIAKMKHPILLSHSICAFLDPRSQYLTLFLISPSYRAFVRRSAICNINTAKLITLLSRILQFLRHVFCLTTVVGPSSYRSRACL